MSKVPWHILKNSQSRAHLVAGAMRTDQSVDVSDLTKAQTELERLVRKLAPTGNYATTIVRDVVSSEVHLAFEDEGDARRLAAAVSAEATVGYPHWTTQQTFLLNDVKVGALLASLPPPMTMRPPPMTERPPRDKLRDEIYGLGQIIEANALTLTSKTMNDDDREALQRQMNTRMAHRKLLQKRLDRLSN
jgi:hypothetical protein